MSKRHTVAPSIVGRRLQTARLLAGLSTDEAAKRLGIKSPSRLTRAEHPNYPKGITPQLLAPAPDTRSTTRPRTPEESPRLWSRSAERTARSK